MITGDRRDPAEARAGHRGEVAGVLRLDALGAGEPLGRLHACVRRLDARGARGAGPGARLRAHGRPGAPPVGGRGGERHALSRARAGEGYLPGKTGCCSGTVGDPEGHVRCLAALRASAHISALRGLPLPPPAVGPLAMMAHSRKARSLIKARALPFLPSVRKRLRPSPAGRSFTPPRHTGTPLFRGFGPSLGVPPGPPPDTLPGAGRAPLIPPPCARPPGAGFGVDGWVFSSST